MVNKLKKEIIVPKLSPQQQMKPTNHKMEERVNFDKKIKYVRSVFLNAMRPHIKNGVGYKSGNKQQFKSELKWKRVHQVHQGKFSPREEAKP
jgi:hypothetical protein